MNCHRDQNQICLSWTAAGASQPPPYHITGDRKWSCSTWCRRTPSRSASTLSRRRLPPSLLSGAGSSPHFAAAVGLWRIRAGAAAAGSSTKLDAGVRGSAVVEDNEPEQAPTTLPTSAAVVDVARPALAEAAEQLVSSPSEPSTPSKVRFAAYYGGGSGDIDGVVHGVRRCADRDGNDDDGDVCGDGEGYTPFQRRTASWRRRRSTALLTTPWEKREMAVRRRGDLGWYRHLDMVLLDSSVVRLWDGEMTAAAAAPSGRTLRAGLESHLCM
ncbi:hypothetical protein GUJ93_ZPchr0009g816 [Zizania palustris]|uniref:Uncharacterized protein n=1 Tax=Zizania palustris TaxID=103762 RepID=A0A8J5RPE2_ZIZPA|nr:hypothetical protein GUJ93_ZPchr0009g816 [Zizania palustris]